MYQRHGEYVEAERERGRRAAALWQGGAVSLVTYVAADAAFRYGPSGLLVRALAALMILAAAVVIAAVVLRAPWRRAAYGLWAGALIATAVAFILP